MADPIFGTTQPTVRDTENVLLTKILETLQTIAASSGAADYEAGGNFFGNGDPNGVVAASKGAIYCQLDAAPPTIWIKTTDTVNTGWE